MHTIGSLKTHLSQIRYPNRFLLRLALFLLAPAICHVAHIARIAGASVGIIAHNAAQLRSRMAAIAGIAMASIGAIAHGVASVRFHIGAIAHIGRIAMAGIGRAPVARIAAAHIQAARIAGYAIAALVIRHAVCPFRRGGRRWSGGAIMRVGKTAMRQAQAQQTAA